MNFWDWLGLTIMLTTLIGGQVTPQDYNAETVRTTEAQAAAGHARAVSGVAIGGKVVMMFADSGLSMSEERAIEARENLNRAIFHYDMAHRYVPFGLRMVGRGDYVQLYYFDLRLVTVTAADAQATGADSAQQLAEVWKGELDRSFRQLPKPMVDGWIATTGSVAGATMVSDDMLASTAAEAIRYAPGQQVKLTARAGVLTVEGTVANDGQRGRLLRTLRRLPGVRHVEDKLQVGGLPSLPKK
jgi:hypothetical protein